MTASPALQATALSRHYSGRRGALGARGTVRALDGVDLQLDRGETLGIVGESGCGKSTLARLLVGLDTPTAGTILVEGQDLSRLGRRDLRRARRDIQIVMQDPYSSLNPRMTAGALIGEPYAIHRDVVPRSARRHRVRELMDLVGLDPGHLNRYPHQFSGGQRQRIGIARALALQPRTIVLDEPVSALDVSVRAQIVNLLKRLQRELGLSYVFIAHDLTLVRHVSDRIAVMYLGVVVETGPAADVYAGATHPYTRALLSAVPSPDPTVRRRDRLVLDGEVSAGSRPAAAGSATGAPRPRRCAPRTSPSSGRGRVPAIPARATSPASGSRSGHEGRRPHGRCRRRRPGRFPGGVPPARRRRRDRHRRRRRGSGRVHGRLGDLRRGGSPVAVVQPLPYGLQLARDLDRRSRRSARPGRCGTGCPTTGSRTGRTRSWRRNPNFRSIRRSAVRPDSTSRNAVSPVGSSVSPTSWTPGPPRR